MSEQTFDELAQIHQAQGPAATAQAEGILGQALGRLFAVAEAYPELKASQNFLELQAQLSDTENKVAVSRQVYNDTVLTFNNAIQTFPAMLIATSVCSILLVAAHTRWSVSIAPATAVPLAFVASGLLFVGEGVQINARHIVFFGARPGDPLTVWRPVITLDLAELVLVD